MTKERIFDFNNLPPDENFDLLEGIFQVLASGNKNRKLVIQNEKKVTKAFDKYNLKMVMFDDEDGFEFSLIEKDKAAVDVTLEEGDSVWVK